MSVESGEDLVRVGRVGKPHGVRGGFYVDGAIAREPLTAGSVVTIAGRAFVIESCGGTPQRPLVALDGLGDRDEAAALRGEVIRAPRSSVPLAEGEWLAGDLEGLTVVGGSGREFGVVDRLTNTPSVDLLEVVSGGGIPLLVPMVSDAIVEIDVAAGRITIDDRFLGLDEDVESE